MVEDMTNNTVTQTPAIDEDMEATLGRMAQRFYEVASKSDDIIFVRMTCKPDIVEALRAAMVVYDARVPRLSEEGRGTR